MGAQTRSWATAACAAALFAGSCSSGGGGADDPGAGSGGGSVFGSAAPSRDPVTAQRIATKAVNQKVGECGGGCSADVAAGREHLSAGRMLEAFEAFKCADTPEAAFGAGIARVLGVVESPAGDAVLADFGLDPMPASDLFGPQGLLARSAARWNGQAQLTATGGVALQLETEQVAADDYDLRVSTYQGASHIEFSIETESTLNAVGTTVALQFDCTTGRAMGTMPYVRLSLRDGDVEQECQLPYSQQPQTCVANGGSIRVVSTGAEEGARVEYELTDVLLECRRHALDDEASDVAPASPLLPPTRLSGHVHADVVLALDTSGLHALFQDDDDLIVDSAPAGATSTQLANHAAAVAGEVASARCYFAKAAEGSGTVFTLPGSLWGGGDVELGAGDARMLAAGAAFAAATIELGTSYEVELSMQQLACSLGDGLDQAAKCGTTRAWVDAVNASARAAKLRHDRLSAARALLELALEDFEAGVDQLDENSALVRDASTMPGWDVMLELVRAAQASLVARTAVPRVSPALHVDAGRFFSSPPDLAAISRPPVLFQEECEQLGGTTDCTRDTGLDSEYQHELLGPYSDIDWDGEYVWQQDEAVEDAAQQIMQQLREKGLMLGD